jgi:hypothetical protein
MQVVTGRLFWFLAFLRQHVAWPGPREAHLENPLVLMYALKSMMLPGPLCPSLNVESTS